MRIRTQIPTSTRVALVGSRRQENSRVAKRTRASATGARSMTSHVRRCSDERAVVRRRPSASPIVMQPGNRHTSRCRQETCALQNEPEPSATGASSMTSQLLPCSDERAAVPRRPSASSIAMKPGDRHTGSCRQETRLLQSEPSEAQPELAQSLPRPAGASTSAQIIVPPHRRCHRRTARPSADGLSCSPPCWTRSFPSAKPTSQPSAARPTVAGNNGEKSWSLTYQASGPATIPMYT